MSPLAWSVVFLALCVALPWAVRQLVSRWAAPRCPECFGLKQHRPNCGAAADFCSACGSPRERRHNCGAY